MGFTITGNKITINKHVAFCKFLKNTIPVKSKKIVELLTDIKNDMQSRAPAATPIPASAFSNASGDWYEWLIAVAAWNYCAANPTANLAMLVPNITSFNLGKLYNINLFNLIEDLRVKVFNASNVQLISSNPDFVIIKRSLIDRHLSISQIVNFDVNSIRMLESVYKTFIGYCDFEDIVGYLSVKSSLRPDRRLQMSHEGSLMKALYTHLQTREWVLNPRGIKYYAMSTVISPADKNALRTVATHSITTVHDNPQAAVDDSFAVNTLQDADRAFALILH